MGVSIPEGRMLALHDKICAYLQSRGEKSFAVYRYAPPVLVLVVCFAVFSISLSPPSPRRRMREILCLRTVSFETTSEPPHHTCTLSHTTFVSALSCSSPTCRRCCGTSSHLTSSCRSFAEVQHAHPPVVSQWGSPFGSLTCSTETVQTFCPRHARSLTRGHSL